MTTSHKLALAPTLALAVALVGLSATAGTMPEVTIAGLAGAAHWAWYEAESNLDNDNGNLYTVDTRYKSDTSGFASSGAYGPNIVHVSDAHVNKTAAWTVTLPAAMAAANFYSFSGSHAPRDFQLLLDGDLKGSYAIPGSGEYRWPNTWTDYAAGALAAGPRLIVLYHLSGSYNAGAAHDGFYIADGELSAFGALASTAVAGMATNRQWRQAPTFADPAAQLFRPVTPIIDIGANEGYLILLNGQPYVSGTPITELGTYMLTVEAFGDTNLDRVLVGAYFEIIPEPTTGIMLLMLTGATLGRRPRRPATRGDA